MNESVEVSEAMARLARLVGEEEAASTFSHCLSGLTADDISSPEELLRLSECLMQLGDVSLLVGRVLRAKALAMSRR
jgi:hypothetical protein